MRYVLSFSLALCLTACDSSEDGGASAPSEMSPPGSAAGSDGQGFGGENAAGMRAHGEPDDCRRSDRSCGVGQSCMETALGVFECGPESTAVDPPLGGGGSDNGHAAGMMSPSPGGGIGAGGKDTVSPGGMTAAPGGHSGGAMPAAGGDANVDAVSAGTDTAGMDSADIDTAGIDTTGIDTAGIDTAGAESVVEDRAGSDTAGTEPPVEGTGASRQ